MYYYDYEYDRIITKAAAEKQYKAFQEMGLYKEKSFKEFVAENLCDLSDETELVTAQALHDRYGMWEPVCSWDVLMERAKAKRKEELCT